MKLPDLTTIIFFVASIIIISGCGDPKSKEGVSQKYREIQSGEPIIIGLKSRHTAIDLAGQELVKYFGLMTGNPDAASVANDPASLYFSAGDGTEPVHIELGLFSDFNIDIDGVEDTDLDDAVYIDVQGSRGIIAGSNPRSVLFAAYRFLEANGCRWIRPGPDGDFVPERQIDNLTVQLTDKAKYRFRGNNNSGAYSIDYIISKIEWGAKVGLNTYFNEFIMPKKFFQSWYSRDYPSNKASCPLSDTEVIAFNERLTKEIKRRGLLLHAAGHGWNGVFFGNPEVECDHWGNITVPENQTELLSLVNGERLRGGPTTTELCYGNPQVRTRLVHLISDYAETHPEVDYLHFWLDDRTNNTCECDLCRHKRVSDHYIKILNDLDTELTERNIPTRIVFLIYSDLIWPPEEEKLINKDRFALMFAPIARFYNEPYELPAEDIDLPPYQMNENKPPSNIQQLVGFLQKWQEAFPGPGFAYDYHMWYFHFYDQGYYGYLNLLAEDIRRLADLKLDGFVSCQMQKTFFPHGLPHFANARLLWNPGNSVDELAGYYFKGSFGEEWNEALDYMKTLSDLFSPEYFYGKKRGRKVDDAETQEARAKLSKVKDAVSEFYPVIERNLDVENSVQNLSWKLLEIHSGMVVIMAEALLARDESRSEDEKAAWEDLGGYFVEHEDITENLFDVWSFKRIFPLLR